MKQRVFCLVMLLLVSICALALSGCGGGTGGAPAIATSAASPTETYWPMQKGYLWRYRLLADPLAGGGPQPLAGKLGNAGKALVSHTYVTKVTGSHLIDGQRWWDLRFLKDGVLDHDVIARHTAGGFANRVHDNTAPWFDIKVPLSVGTTWALPPVNGSDIQGTIEKTTGGTTVPAGTFRNCLIVRHDYLNPMYAGLAMRFWYAPGVGLVRVEGVASGIVLYRQMLLSTTVPH